MRILYSLLNKGFRPKQSTHCKFQLQIFIFKMLIGILNIGFPA